MQYKLALSNGSEIYYHERGSGQPLVLIMGFGADGTLWEKHAAAYEQHFRCIVIDNRGVGKSAQPAGPYSTAMMARDTIAVMDHAGVGKAHVAGISMGGAIAQELVIGFPERVASLALISTWAKFDNYSTAIYENLKHIRRQVSPDYFTELLQLWIFSPKSFDKQLAALQADALNAGKQPAAQSRNGFEGQLDACIHHDTVARLSQINVPTLITIGGRDIFTPPHFSDLLHDHIPGSRLSVYPDGGHVHHWEDLERFNTETLNFFKSNQYVDHQTGL